MDMRYESDGLYHIVDYEGGEPYWTIEWYGADTVSEPEIYSIDLMASNYVYGNPPENASDGEFMVESRCIVYCMNFTHPDIIPCGEITTSTWPRLGCQLTPYVKIPGFKRLTLTLTDQRNYSGYCRKWVSDLPKISARWDGKLYQYDANGNAINPSDNYVYTQYFDIQMNARVEWTTTSASGFKCWETSENIFTAPMVWADISPYWDGDKCTTLVTMRVNDTQDIYLQVYPGDDTSDTVTLETSQPSSSCLTLKDNYNNEIIPPTSWTVSQLPGHLTATAKGLTCSTGELLTLTYHHLDVVRTDALAVRIAPNDYWVADPAPTSTGVTLEVNGVMTDVTSLTNYFAYSPAATTLDDYGNFSASPISDFDSRFTWNMSSWDWDLIPYEDTSWNLAAFQDCATTSPGNYGAKALYNDGDTGPWGADSATNDTPLNAIERICTASIIAAQITPPIGYLALNTTHTFASNILPALQRTAGQWFTWTRGTNPDTLRFIVNGQEVTSAVLEGSDLTSVTVITTSSGAASISLNYRSPYDDLGRQVECTTSIAFTAFSVAFFLPPENSVFWKGQSVLWRARVSPEDITTSIIQYQFTCTSVTILSECFNGNYREMVGEPTSTGTVNVKVSATIEGSTAEADRATSVGGEVNLKRITFTGPIHSILADNGTTSYSGPHWVDNSNPLNGTASDAGDSSQPVCYTRNTTMSAEIDIELSCTAGLSFSTLLIKGEGPDGLDFPPTTITASGTTFSIPIECAKPFQDWINFYNPMSIAWSYSPDGGKLWNSVCSSDHRVYITFYDPSGPGPLYETPLWIGCKNCIGDTTTASIVEHIWAEFPGLNVHRIDGTQMTYWYNNPTNQDIGDLLQYGDGSCRTWAQLQHWCMKSQGLKSISQVWELVPDDTVNTSAAVILVKNWGFDRHIRTGADNVCDSVATGDDVPVIPSGTNSLCILPGADGILDSVTSGNDIYQDGLYAGSLYPYEIMCDAQDTTGVPAHGNINPPAGFFNHYVCRITTNGPDPSNPGVIYDPSYGIGPFEGSSPSIQELNHENAACDGIACSYVGSYGHRRCKKNEPAKELQYSRKPSAE
ncbi:MAG: hypothetical protein NTX50_20070 [Candidatus Sumerlaeota bacterium]|nr:hypothetical protein [Candidatus Sumerlaeota bacterium]